MMTRNAMLIVATCSFVAILAAALALSLDATSLLAPGWPGAGGWLVPVGLVIALGAIFVPVVFTADGRDRWSALDGAKLTFLTAMLPVALVLEPFLQLWWFAPLHELSGGPVVSGSDADAIYGSAISELFLTVRAMALAVLATLTGLGAVLAIAFGGGVRFPRPVDRAPWGTLTALAVTAVSVCSFSSSVGEFLLDAWPNPFFGRSPIMVASAVLLVTPIIAQCLMVALVVMQVVRAAKSRRLGVIATGLFGLVLIGSAESAAVWLATQHLLYVGVLSLTFAVGSGLGLVAGWYRAPMNIRSPESSFTRHFWSGVVGGGAAYWLAYSGYGWMASHAMRSLVTPALRSAAVMGQSWSTVDAATAFWSEQAPAIALMLLGAVAGGAVLQSLRWAAIRLLASPHPGQDAPFGSGEDPVGGAYISSDDGSTLGPPTGSSPPPPSSTTVPYPTE